MTFATKSIRHHPPHLRYVATLFCETKKTQMFCLYSADVHGIKKMQISTSIFIASNFAIHPEILIFLVFKIASCSPYWLQIKLSMSLYSYLFTFEINLRHRKFVTVDVAGCSVCQQSTWYTSTRTRF